MAGNVSAAQGRRLRPGTFLDAKELLHVAVVLLLAALRAQVEPQLVDHLYAEVPQPLVPAVGADGFVDLAADLVVHGRAGELAGAGAPHAAGPLAAEAAALAGAPRRGPLRHRRRLAQLHQH